MATLLKQLPDNQGDTGIGLSFHEDGICVACPHSVEGPTENGLPLTVDFFPARGADVQVRLLQKLASRHSLRSLPATIVMNPASYRLLQVPIPQVQQSEIDSALRWQIRDLVDMDVEDAIILSYPMPGQGRPSSPLLFVVVAERNAVTRAVEMASDAGIKVVSVTTVELALRTLLGVVEKSEQPSLLLAIFPEKTFLIHVVNGELYRTRELDYGAAHLPGSGGGAEDGSWPQRLVTEVGRFVLFCGRHCEQGSAQRLLVPSIVTKLPELSAQLAEETGIAVEQFSPCPVDPHCLPALGAACNGMGGG